MSDILKAVEETKRGLRKAGLMHDYNFSLKKNSLILKRVFFPKNFFEESRYIHFLPFGGMRGFNVFRKGTASFRKLKRNKPFRSPCKWRWYDSNGSINRYRYYVNEREVSWIRDGLPKDVKELII